MKFLSTFSLVLVATAQGKSLRAVEERHLQSADASTVNAAVAAQLPTVNSVLQSNIPDPATVTRTFSSSLTPATGACSGVAVAAAATITQMSNTKSLTVDSLTVIENDNFNFATDCFGVQSDFSGDFNYQISASSLAAAGTTSLTPADSCSSAYTSDFTGSATNVVFTGTASIAGQIVANAALIETANINTITSSVGSSAFTPTTAIPADYSAISAAYSAAIQAQIVAYVNNQLAGELSSAINDNLRNAKTDLGLGGGVPFIIQMYQAGVENRINNMRDTSVARVESIRNQAEVQIEAMRMTVEGRATTLEASATDTVDSWTTKVTNKISSWATAATARVNSVGIHIGDGDV